MLFCYCVFQSFFSPFSIAITSLGEERANLSAFRTFVRFALVWFCLFTLSLGVWEGLGFVTVAFPGLLSYRLFHRAACLLQMRMSFLMLNVTKVSLYCMSYANIEGPDPGFL